MILDDSDQANALGYHELSKTGTPLGKVFVRSVQQSGGSTPNPGRPAVSMPATLPARDGPPLRLHPATVRNLRAE